jgi:hypothetical protein
MMAGGVNDGAKLRGGQERIAVTVVMSCHIITTQSFARRKKRFLKALAIAKTWFSM